MSQFCQFCDKEMLLDHSVVHVHGYITCGSIPCTKNAKENSEYHARIANEKEHPTEIETQIIVFQSTNPYNPRSWRMVKPQDYPEFISDPDMLGQLLNGEIANIYKANQKGMVYYCAKRLVEVRKALGSVLNA